MSEVTRRRFLIVHQVMQYGLNDKEMACVDASALSLIFCCGVNEHIDVLA